MRSPEPLFMSPLKPTASSSGNLMGGLLDQLKQVKDPRVDPTKRHLLSDILAIAICAVICGADEWTEMEAFGKAKQPW
ncbi:MAG: transposase family protein, partial [Acidimicrobiia bacterium]|nr:transposase family protein [Acidimicrobiia bacterium]MBM3803035.1 transposase family protein [Acidimicrobiia bacterium]MBM3803246.1 transposase family protein [Acidimicrobiia bacterium]MBM3803426.1 transposase family protein [Acidimicrobiia bacterium]MBM3803482.1 transposase family protein [Acidimicrobiia bacterium]